MISFMYAQTGNLFFSSPLKGNIDIRAFFFRNSEAAGSSVLTGGDCTLNLLVLEFS